jgi:AraC-like DNA-binding protein
LLAVSAANIFETLNVAATIWDGEVWRHLHRHESVIWFEVEHGVELERNRHNTRFMNHAWKKRELVIGKHAGLSDLFAPIVADDRVLGVLLVGPFGTERPSATDLLARWKALTGRQGHPSDPAFAHFVSMSLSTLVLDTAEVRSFSRLIALFGALIAGTAAAETLRVELDELMAGLAAARHVERVWDAARSLVDEETSRTWATPFRDLESVGLTRVPERVLVALSVARERDPDPVEDLVRRDAFQRACVKLGASAGAISGRVGDYGVTFLSTRIGSEARRRQHLLELSDKATALARRHGLDLHFGLSGLPAKAPLWDRYSAALAAAESALIQRTRLVEGAREARPGARLAELRQGLAKAAQRDPDILPAQFDRYLESVRVHSGMQLGPIKVELEAGFERLSQILLESGSLDAKSLRDSSDGLERAALDARTIAELFDAYRRSVRDLAEAVKHPVPARRERSLRRAVTYIHRHYAEPLSLPLVARIAGFAPSYFSVLFQRRERTSFESYVQKLRVERAKQLLATTDLRVERVAQLSGFVGRPHFSQVFKRSVGVTPSQHREALFPGSRRK